MNTLRFFLPMVLLFVICTPPAWALDLQQARAQGIIAEQPDGFVRLVVNTPEAAALVQEINAARLAEYQRISKEKNQPTEVIAKIAAEEIARKLKQ